MRALELSCCPSRCSILQALAAQTEEARAKAEEAKAKAEEAKTKAEEENTKLKDGQSRLKLLLTKSQAMVNENKKVWRRHCSSDL